MNAKQRWNAKHYVQINVALPRELAETFKSRCVADSVSVAGEIARLLRENLSVPPTPKKRPAPTERRFDTRLNRRKAIKNVIYLLEEIKIAEETYRDSIPEPLQETNSVGIDDALAALDDVIDELSGIDIYPEPPVRRKFG
jgi:hypothetical protein